MPTKYSSGFRGRPAGCQWSEFPWITYYFFYTPTKTARCRRPRARPSATAAGLGGASWDLGLVGGDVKAAADELADCGAARTLAVSGEDFSVSRYATDAAAAEAICRASGAGLILAPHTPRWARSLPGVAHRIGAAIDAHVAGVETTQGVSITRWYYRKRIEGKLTRAKRPWMLLLDAGSPAEWTGAPGTANVEAVPVAVGDNLKRTTVVGFQSPQTDQQTIRPESPLLFVAGAGWTKKQPDGQVHTGEAAELILGFVNGAKASLGSSKSLVDLSGEGQAVLPFLTHLHQVGQTGSTPRHKKGLSTCCHGEEPHVVGWRFIAERRAVNLDANCGWARGKADVLYVADAFAVMRALNEKLK